MQVHMKYLKIILQILLLYCYFFVGDFLQSITQFPLPGSIVGLLLLWGSLFIKILPLHWVELGSNSLLSYLPIFFIPAIVGVMEYWEVFVGKGLLLFLIIVISTLLTMGISGVTSQLLARRSAKRKERLVCKQS